MIKSIEPRTDALVKMWRKGSESDRSMLGAMHEHYEREVRRMVEEGNEPQNIAHTLHCLIDESVAQMLDTPNGREVSCSKGCAGCCSLHVTVTEAEAVLLLVYMKQAGIEIDWDKLRRQARCNFKQWNEQQASERRCVFLGTDNLCKVYEHRPASCRKYMVLSDPKYCDTVRYPGHGVAILAAPVGEVVTSAMLGVLHAGSLPRMLLEAKENNG